METSTSLSIVSLQSAKIHYKTPRLLSDFTFNCVRVHFQSNTSEAPFDIGMGSCELSVFALRSSLMCFSSSCVAEVTTDVRDSISSLVSMLLGLSWRSEFVLFQWRSGTYLCRNLLFRKQPRAKLRHCRGKQQNESRAIAHIIFGRRIASPRTLLMDLFWRTVSIVQHAAVKTRHTIFFCFVLIFKHKEKEVREEVNFFGG